MSKHKIKIKSTDLHHRINPYYSSFLYSVGYAFSNLIFDHIWRRDVKGKEHIPSEGTGVIFASNHRSLADPNLVGSAVPYPIHFFAKEELFNVPIVGWYIRRVNSFPVRRKAQDVTAFKQAVHVLKTGGGLLVFPEGGRRLDESRQWKAKPGIGMMACKTGVPVIPVYVHNSAGFTKLQKISVRFGPALHPPKEDDRTAHQDFSNLIMDKIKDLSGEWS